MKINLLKKRKKIFLPLAFLFFVVGSIFVYLRFFRPSLSLEEKFVVEERPLEQTLPSAKPELTGAPTAGSLVNLIQPAERASLPGTKVTYQTFNNCGPANLSMILSYYGIKKSQEELADKLRPYRNPQGDNDDKTVSPGEFVATIEEFGLKSMSRPNGSIQLIKQFLANEIPVVVKTLWKRTEDSAHYRIVRGFDEDKQVIIVDDSYFGPNRKISYFDFLELWQPFNYVYVPVYRAEKEKIVQAILGQEIDEEVAYWRAINRAQKEIEKDPQNIWPKFNLTNNYYHVGQYQKCVEEFEMIESQLPRRALWYQIEPILAYQKLKNYDRAFQIIDRVLNDDNRAFSELYQIKGEINLEQGNKEAARREFEQAIQYNKNYLPAKEALSRL